MVSREEDRVGVSWLLLQLYGNRHQLVAAVNIEKQKRSNIVATISSGQSIHDLQVTDIDMSCLHVRVDI